MSARSPCAPKFGPLKISRRRPPASDSALNGDGPLDRIFHFKTTDTVHSCRDIPSGQSQSPVFGYLKANLQDRHDLRFVEFRILLRASLDHKSCQKSPLAKYLPGGEAYEPKLPQQQAPDMNVAVGNAELPIGERSHPLARAQRRAKAVRGWAVEQGHLQARQLLAHERNGASTLAHRAKRVQPIGFEHPAPAVHGLTRRPDRYTDFGRVPCLQQSRAAHTALAPASSLLSVFMSEPHRHTDTGDGGIDCHEVM